MTVEEFRARKAETEKHIQELIRLFQEATGVKVGDIGFEWIYGTVKLKLNL